MSGWVKENSLSYSIYVWSEYKTLLSQLLFSINPHDLDSIAVSVFVVILIEFDKYNQKQIPKEI